MTEDEEFEEYNCINCHDEGMVHYCLDDLCDCIEDQGPWMECPACKKVKPL